jgi:hypothetical protein
MVEDRNDLNVMDKQVVKECRANEGKTGGRFQGAPLFLRHTVGAKSDEARINLMMFQQLAEKYTVLSSMAGAAQNHASNEFGRRSLADAGGLSALWSEVPRLPAVGSVRQRSFIQVLRLSWGRVRIRRRDHASDQASAGPMTIQRHELVTAALAFPL